MSKYSLFLLAGVVVVGCSGGPNLSDEERVVAVADVTEVAKVAGIAIAEQDGSCVIDHLSNDDVDELSVVAASLRSDEVSADAGDLESGLSGTVSEAVVACVGKSTLVQSGLLASLGSGSEESLECMGKRFDEDLLLDLIGSELQGRDEIPLEVEIEVALTAGVCLTPEEILQLPLG